MELHTVPVDKPEDMNVIVGQAHFIKTVEDIHEALPEARRQVWRGGVSDRPEARPGRSPLVPQSLPLR